MQNNVSFLFRWVEGKTNSAVPTGRKLFFSSCITRPSFFHLVLNHFFHLVFMPSLFVFCGKKMRGWLERRHVQTLTEMLSEAVFLSPPSAFLSGFGNFVRWHLIFPRTDFTT